MQWMNLADFQRCRKFPSKTRRDSCGYPIESLEQRRLLSTVGFLAPVATPIASTFGVTSTLTGDLNGDGIPDLVTVSASAQTSVYLGTATGTFTLASTQLTGGQFAALGAFTTSGNLDLATVNGVMLGNGDGTFNSPVGGFTLPSGTVGFVTGDFNGDGNLDLGAETLTGSSSSPTLSIVVLPGLGNGAFGTPVTTIVATGSVITSKYADFQVGDFNNDSRLDLVTPFGVMLGNGNGGFGAPIPFPLASSPSTPIFTTGDFNDDGNLDVAVVASSSSSASGAGQIQLLIGNGDGSFTGSAIVPVNGGTVTALDRL